MMAIKSKACYPKVIKFGRSGKRERRPQRRKKSKVRDKKKKINKQPISAMAGLLKSIRNNEQEKKRERRESEL